MQPLNLPIFNFHVDTCLSDQTNQKESQGRSKDLNNFNMPNLLTFQSYTKESNQILYDLCSQSNNFDPCKTHSCICHLRFSDRILRIGLNGYKEKFHNEENSIFEFHKSLVGMRGVNETGTQDDPQDDPCLIGTHGVDSGMPLKNVYDRYQCGISEPKIDDEPISSLFLARSMMPITSTISPSVSVSNRTKTVTEPLYKILPPNTPLPKRIRLRLTNRCVLISSVLNRRLVKISFDKLRTGPDGIFYNKDLTIKCQKEVPFFYNLEKNSIEALDGNGVRHCLEVDDKIEGNGSNPEGNDPSGFRKITYRGCKDRNGLKEGRQRFIFDDIKGIAYFDDPKGNQIDDGTRSKSCVTYPENGGKVTKFKATFLGKDGNDEICTRFVTKMQPAVNSNGLSDDKARVVSRDRRPYLG